MVVVGGVGSVLALQPLLLLLHKVGVGAGAGGGHPGQPAVGPRLIPGRDQRWCRWSRGRDRRRDLGGDRDGGRDESRSGGRYRRGTGAVGAVVGVVGGGGVVLLMVLVVVAVVEWDR